MRAHCISWNAVGWPSDRGDEKPKKFTRVVDNLKYIIVTYAILLRCDKRFEGGELVGMGKANVEGGKEDQIRAYSLLWSVSVHRNLCIGEETHLDI